MWKFKFGKFKFGKFKFKFGKFEFGKFKFGKFRFEFGKFKSLGNKNSVGISMFPHSINHQGIRLAWEYLFSHALLSPRE